MKNSLIEKLYRNPKDFYNKGLAYDLLQVYFNDLDLVSLKSLLEDEDVWVNKAGIWIASELGVNAAPVIDSAIKCLKSDDGYVRYYALEVILVCAEATNSEHIHYLFDALLDSEPSVLTLAMGLVSNVTKEHILTGIDFFTSVDPNKEHIKGLNLLLADDIPNSFQEQLQTQSLFSIYSAIQVRRYEKKHKQKIDIETNAVVNDAVREFLSSSL